MPPFRHTPGDFVWERYYGCSCDIDLNEVLAPAAERQAARELQNAPRRRGRPRRVTPAPRPSSRER